MFEPFRQADGSTTRVHGGLGLGLSIVKHLVEAHGGRVMAQSGGDGRGATFIVRLPTLDARREPLASAPADRATPPADATPATLEGLSVLVVDDDAETRQVMKAHLEGHRAVVLTAASTPQALDVLEHTRVDVLLADIAMPGEDGYSLIRKLRAWHARPEMAAIPAAAFTALVREEDRRHALQAGFQMHLAKPIDADSAGLRGRASGEKRRQNLTMTPTVPRQKLSDTLVSSRLPSPTVRMFRK
jgi:CheY-like chemotaxis protein